MERADIQCGYPNFEANLPRPKSKGKYIQDDVHGIFRMDPLCVRIIDTPPFQRLRECHQLGLTHMIYPTANHKRFEHSLGVAHLAQQVGEKIWKDQGKRGDVDMDRNDIKCVTLAGLLHDVGHGPFSHVFDYEFLKLMGINNWYHEDMSCKILDLILDRYLCDSPQGADGTASVSDDDAKLIKRLIDRDRDNMELKADAKQGGDAGVANRRPYYDTRRFLFDIVANQRNSIDVDKFDYLARDSRAVGMKLGVDFKRIMQFSRVLDDQICFKQSEYHNIYQLFHGRMMMHRQVYTHKKAKSLEFMVVDALKAAEPVLKLTEKIYDPEQFILLNDTLITTIKQYGVWARPPFEEGSEEWDALKRAQGILQRVERRELYRHVNEILVPPEVLRHTNWHVPTAEEILACYRPQESSQPVNLNVDDVIVSKLCINYSMKDANPLDNVLFFTDFADDEPRHIMQQVASSLMPMNFQETTLRLYSRNRSPEVVTALQEALESWRKVYCNSGSLQTPFKPGRTSRRNSDAADTTGSLHGPPAQHTGSVRLLAAAAANRSNGGGEGGLQQPLRKRRRSLADEIEGAQGNAE